MSPSLLVKAMDEGREASGLTKEDSRASITEAEDLDLRTRLIIERKRSFDERSLSEHAMAVDLRSVDSHDSMFYLGATRSVPDSPTSSVNNSFEPHPMVAEAWEALRKSIVLFRGQPVGIIAAYDHAAEEVLNYDQVKYARTELKS